MADDNFGITLKKGSTSIGVIKNVDPPGLMKEAIEVTSHASTAKEFITSPVPELEEFVATIYLAEGAYGTLKTDFDSGTPATYNIVFPDAGSIAYAFSAIVRGLKVNTSDATSVDALLLDVTFRPTGALTVS